MHVLNKSHQHYRHADTLQQHCSSTSAAGAVALPSERCRACRGYYLLVGSLRRRWLTRWSWQPASGGYWCRTRLCRHKDGYHYLSTHMWPQRRWSAIWFAPSKVLQRVDVNRRRLTRGLILPRWQRSINYFLEDDSILGRSHSNFASSHGDSVRGVTTEAVTNEALSRQHYWQGIATNWCLNRR